MQRPLELQIHRHPHPDAEQEADQALGLIADALADLLIAEARAAVARDRGVDERAIDREQVSVAAEARETVLTACFPTRGRDGSASPKAGAR